MTPRNAEDKTDGSNFKGRIGGEKVEPVSSETLEKSYSDEEKQKRAVSGQHANLRQKASVLILKMADTTHLPP